MIPEWMKQDETELVFENEKHALLDQNKAVIRHLLAKLQEEHHKEIVSLHPGVQLCNTLLVIFALCLSHTSLNILIIAIYEGIFLVLLRGDTIAKILKLTAGFTLLNIFFCLPMIFFSRINVLFIIKNMLIFLALNMYMETTTFYDFLIALRKFHVPNFIIFQLDILIRYLHLLGQLLLDMMTAIEARSVGSKSLNRSLISSLFGNLYLKMRVYGLELFNAMEARAFTGEYEVPTRQFQTKDRLLLGVQLGLVLILVIGGSQGV